MHWYLVHTKPRQETAPWKTSSAKGFSAICPPFLPKSSARGC